ncbi:hypothetical protein A8F95_14350 [Bacillus wudalianchiensis]|uniref:Uncharacterized protein n=1 Tax=Pseudobacillus wudalianchiensis TaxID=1743143 RepID=A0A1B9AGD5_9BACI|nr:hypothetical protein A8F95_14350 [Bacillus wudalianchiensis]
MKNGTLSIRKKKAEQVFKLYMALLGEAYPLLLLTKLNTELPASTEKRSAMYDVFASLRFLEGKMTFSFLSSLFIQYGKSFSKC